MNITIKHPPLGRLLDQLQAAGIKTNSARGFWGGVSRRDEIVVTTWIDERDREGRFVIWRPNRNNGGLKSAWESRRIKVGVNVRVILVRRQGRVPPSQGRRTVRDAALLPGKWRVVAMIKDGGAAIEPTYTGTTSRA